MVVNQVPDRLRRLFWLSWGAALLLGIVLVFLIFPYQADDAFITYRYAANVAAGHGISYNPGLGSEEGFSSPLWLALLSLLAVLFGSDALPFSGFLLGLVSWLALLAATGCFFYRGCFRKKEIAPASALLFPFLLVLSPPFLFYTGTGLEMILFAAALFLASAALFGEISFRAGSAAAFLLAWIRPEGLWLAACCIVMLTFSREFRILFRSAGWRIMLGWAAGVALLLASRLMLFGGLLPNTYAAKKPDLLAGVVYLKDFILSPFGAALLLAAGCLFLCRWGAARHYLPWGLLWMAAVLLEGGDWMPHYRFLIPAWLFLLAAVSIRRGGERDGHIVKIKWRAFTGSLLAVFFVISAAAEALEIVARSGQSHLRSSFREYQIARWLKGNGFTSVASVDIGVLGYFSGLEVFDPVGLTDPRVAAAPGGHLRKNFEFGYFLKRAPQVVIIRSDTLPEIRNGILKKLRPSSHVEAFIMTRAEFSGSYRFLFSLELAGESAPAKLFFIRSDLRADRFVVPGKRMRI